MRIYNVAVVMIKVMVVVVITVVIMMVIMMMVVVLEKATAPRVGVDSQALVAGVQGWLVCRIS